MQKPFLALVGQTVIELYPHPLCSQIAAAPDGSVYTLWTKGRGSRRPQLTDKWRLQDTYCGAKFRPKQSIALPSEVAKQLPHSGYRVLAGRFNLECYLGRTLLEHEVCRHGDKGNSDHSIDNLTAGCQLNNIIDEVESGRIKTTRAELERAITRLECILTSTKPNEPHTAD